MIPSPPPAATGARHRRPFPRVAGESLWYAAAGSIGKALALLTVPFISRALGPADYGLTDLSTATAGLLAMIAMFAGDIPSARLAGRTSAQESRHAVYAAYILAVTVIGVGVALLLLPAAGFIATVVWSSPGSDDLVSLAIALVPITAVRTALVTLQRLERRPRTFALLATIDLIAQLALAVALVALGLGPYGAVLGFIGGSLLGLVVAAVAARNMLTPRIDIRLVPSLVGMGLPFLPAFIAFIAADFIARSIVADVMGQSAVGASGVAIRLASVLALMSAAFQLAWGPQAIAMNADSRTAGVFGRVLLGYTVIAGVACVMLASIGPEVIAVMSGGAFLPAAAALPGLAVAAVMTGSHYILAMGAGISGRSWMVAASSILGAAVQVLVTALLVVPLGLTAVGLGAVAGRGASVTALTLRVGPIFDNRLWTASGLLFGVAVLGVLIGWLNLAPQETVFVRVLIATVTGGVGIAFAAAWLRGGIRQINE